MTLHFPKLFSRIFILLLTLFSTSTKSNAQALRWAKHLGGSYDLRNSHLAVDKSGNIFTAGLFTGVVDFNPGAGVAILPSAHNNDFFLTKFDSSGNFVWVKTFGGNIQCTSITTDTNGYIYLTGWFVYTVDFDFDSTTSHTVTVQGYTPFILKIDGNGSFIFVKTFEVTNSGFSNSIAVDDSGQIVIAGNFGGTIDCDPDTGSYILTSAGLYDAYAIKLDSAGKFIWGVRMGGLYNDKANSICLDHFGNTYCTGSFQSTINFYPDSNLTDLTSNGINDIFIFKVGTSGKYEWVDQFGGSNSDYGNAIESDNQGNIYVSGNFQSLIDFDNGPGTLILTLNSTSDIYLVKLDSSGNSLWAEQISGASAHIGLSMKVSNHNEVYITSSFLWPSDFDPGPSVYALNPVGGFDVFVIKIGFNGTFEWVKTFGGANDEFGASVTTDNFDHVFLSGDFIHTVDFDPNGAVYNLTTNGAFDIFIVKLGPCIPTSFSPTAVACHSYSLNGVVYDSSGTYIQQLNNLAGCDSTITLSLSIFATNANVTVNGGTITANLNLASYQWLDCNNNYAPIAGETNRSYTPAVNGSYAVRVTKSNCTDTSICVQIVTAEINQAASNSAFQVYPNPSSNYLTIISKEKIESLSILNLIGDCMMTQAHPNEPLDISQLSAGTYIIMIKTANQLESRKLLVKS